MIRTLDVDGRPTGIYRVDPTACFEPGQIGALINRVGEVVMTVCDGNTMIPYGIIDDVRTQVHTRPVSNEERILSPSAITTNSDGILVTTFDEKDALEQSNIIESSFVSDVQLLLFPINGMVVIPAGTALNYDSDGNNVFDSIRVVVSYMFEIAGVPGADTTIASGKITVWNRRGEYIVDKYDPTQPYQLNDLLFCNECGMFTTLPPCDNAMPVGFVTGPPTAENASLQILWR